MARNYNRPIKQIEFIGYVDITLDDAQKKEFKKWQETVTDLGALLEEYAENSYKVTLSYDSANSCYRAGIMTSDPKSDQAGYIFVGRGSSVFGAVLQAIYKDRYVAQGNWRAFTNARRQDWD